jgi:hypothetical protein
MINLERAILGTENVAVSSEIGASATTYGSDDTLPLWVAVKQGHNRPLRDGCEPFRAVKATADTPDAADAPGFVSN